MIDLPDAGLLEEFVRNKSEAAFTTLVQRHVNLVYSAALRHTADRHAAEEITQAVFIILARRAGSIGRKTVLPGWLYRTVRFTASNWQRSETRRVRREQEAFMQSTLEKSAPEAAWHELAPALDDAMAGLGATDREALVLRYFQNKNLHEVAAALGMEERAAQKRVMRALDKLRKIFGKHGVTLTATLIASSISANAVQPAPAGLAVTTSSAAVGATISAPLAALVNGTMKAMTWVKLKFAIGTGAAVLIAGSVMVIMQPAQSSRSTTSNPGQPGAVAGGAGVVATTRQEPAAGAVAMPMTVREPLTDAARFTLVSPPGGLALQPDGRIIVGTTLFGAFVDEKTGGLGFYHRGVMRLNSDGSLDRSFLCDIGREGSAAERAHVEVARDGRIFMSGVFDAVDGQPRPGYTVLLPDGKVDESFQPWRGSTNATGRAYVAGGSYLGTWLADGTVAILSGAVEGTRAPFPETVYRLDSSGKWIRPATDLLESEFLRPSGLVLTLGEVGFWARRPVDWTSDVAKPNMPVGDLPFDHPQTRPPTAYDAARVFRALFTEVPIEICRYAVRLPDGGTIIAIRDAGPSPELTSPGRFMRFDRNWKPDFSFTNQYEADLRSRISLKRQKDGKLLVAGLVGKMNGENLPGLVRLDENGRLDRTFRCEILNDLDGRVMDLAIQADGRIVIGGFFSAVNGVEVPHLARLNPDGSLDESFRPPFLTRTEFDRGRFSKMRRLPVTRLSETPTPATSLASNVPPASEQTIQITSLNLFGDAALIEFKGAPNQQYILQAKDSMGQSEWVNVGTNKANPMGGGMFRDQEAGQHPMRFYRIASP